MTCLCKALEFSSEAYAVCLYSSINYWASFFSVASLVLYSCSNFSLSCLMLSRFSFNEDSLASKWAFSDSNYLNLDSKLPFIVVSSCFNSVIFSSSFITVYLLIYWFILRSFYAVLKKYIHASEREPMQNSSINSFLWGPAGPSSMKII